MDRRAIERLLTEARALIRHREYVIIGSLSVLGAVEHPPAEMLGSIDIDLYPKDDPGRAFELAGPLGLGSTFEAEHGYYADAVSPMLPTLPDGWQNRLIEVRFPSGVAAWFLHPGDAAVSKYVRGEQRDRNWLRAGLRAGIFSLETVEYRMRETVMETDERVRAAAAIAEDRDFLHSISAGDAPSA